MKVSGKDLIALGYQPGKWFRVALDYLNANSLAEAEMKVYLDTVAPKIEIIDPHLEAVPYHQNIRAEHPDEVANVASVFETMNVLMKTPTVINGAVMPDACPTGRKGQIPVGGIVVTKGTIHPAMHSADICCSVMMTSFGNVDPKLVLDTAQSVTHFGGGGRTDCFELPDELETKMMDNFFLNTQRSLHLAKTHLGTQGDGNHFLYVGKSEATGETIMVTHHGSRGLGANLYKAGMKIAEAYRQQYSPKTLKTNAWIPYDSEKGKQYWEALQLVRAWTKLNHEVLHNAIGQKAGATIVDRFWNEHNFVFKDGDDFYHAKGATPLDDRFVPDSKDGLRLIPLNMREPILVVKGETTENNLGFAPHGAGRNISRSQHVRNNSDRTINEIFAEETENIDARFYSGNIDISELPSAYKNAQEVQAQMQEFGLGTVVDRIMPYGCIMAGDWQIEAPWRKRRRLKKEAADKAKTKE
ncbi:MAG: RtcB family protein [Saprospiraceae bacterium]